MEFVTASVHDIVDFFFAQGDIFLSGPQGPLMEEGSQRHREIQSARPDSYISEYPVSWNIAGSYVNLLVQGRIDGILPQPDGIIVEEIKTTAYDPGTINEENHPAYWAQARLYASILLKTAMEDPENLPFPVEFLEPDIIIRLTCFSRLSGETASIDTICPKEGLLSFFDLITEGYLEWVESLGEWHSSKLRSLPSIEFPFDSYRKGQELLCEEVASAIEGNQCLYIHAPTGIGKTAGVLFPAIKSLSKSPGRKIFYLTAKSSGKEIAEKTLDILRQKGLKLKSLTLTAKSRICFMMDSCEGESPPCNPEICSYAKGHYSRVNDALKAVFVEENITQQIIEHYAREYHVCPFELSLDAALAADLIICDYNYVFDPRVRLIRFFRKRGDYLFLVDEAHNLIDRGREIFSASLYKKDILSLKRLLKDISAPMAKILGELNAVFLSLGKTIEGSAFYIDHPQEPGPLINDWVSMFEWAIKHSRFMPPQAYDFYYNAVAFMKILTQYDDAYRTHIRLVRGNGEIRLCCMDPSRLLLKSLRLAKASLLFSATLTPVAYHTGLISRGKGEVLELESPFPRENRVIILDSSLSTLYRDRDRNSLHIARRIAAVAHAHPGNYMAFFPSYAFLSLVEMHLRTYSASQLVIHSHASGMNDSQRREFIGLFDTKSDTSMLALTVMGGLFGEGIDLAGDKLSGAIIVGPGLPQICPERDILKAYFDEGTGSGFDYAYTYPGFIKVLQAAGRVIRTGDDRGVILYIGQRFAQPRYMDIFPDHMKPDVCIRSETDLDGVLNEFWSGIQIS